MAVDERELRELRLLIKDILNRDWDPIGVWNPIGGGPEDEYESYAETLASMMFKNATDEQILKYLEWAEVKNMGLRKPFNRERGYEVIEELRAIRPKPFSD